MRMERICHSLSVEWHSWALFASLQWSGMWSWPQTSSLSSTGRTYSGPAWVQRRQIPSAGKVRCRNCSFSWHPQHLLLTPGLHLRAQKLDFLIAHSQDDSGPTLTSEGVHSEFWPRISWADRKWMPWPLSTHCRLPRQKSCRFSRLCTPHQSCLSLTQPLHVKQGNAQTLKALVHGFRCAVGFQGVFSCSGRGRAWQRRVAQWTCIL